MEFAAHIAGLHEFTELQLAQLRGVVRDAIEESVRVAIRSEFETLADKILGQSPQDLSVAGASCGARGEAAPASEAAPCRREVSKNNVEASTKGLGEEISPKYRETRSRSKAVSEVSDLVRESSRRTKTLDGLTNRWARTQCRARRLVHGRKGSSGTTFDGVMGCIILANSIVIAFETEFRIENKEPGYLFWMESFFLACFIAELGVRWIADGMHNLSSAWFWFDLTLVVTGMISTLVDSLKRSFSSLDDVPLISQVLALRVLRLFRLVRAVRMTEQFKELWKLCSGLAKSATTMLSVCLVVLVSIFVFACLGVDLITFSDTLARNAETDAIVKRHFYSLPMIMLSLMQFANADSIAGIYMPLCREQPLLVIYFLVLWLVVTVALMNLVTAIIVESAMRQGREDAEERKNELRKVLRKILPEIQQVFDNLDYDGSGSLGIEEIEEAARNGELVLPETIKEYVAPDTLRDVFDVLDVDQSGEIDKAEFVDGVCTLVVSAVPIETTQILQLLRHTHQVLMETHKTVGRISGHCPLG